MKDYQTADLSEKKTMVAKMLEHTKTTDTILEKLKDYRIQNNEQLDEDTVDLFYQILEKTRKKSQSLKVEQIQHNQTKLQQRQEQEKLENTQELNQIEDLIKNI